MSGRVLPFIGSTDAWESGAKTVATTCALAPNPSPWTLDGTNTWILHAPGATEAIIIDPGPGDEGHLISVIAQVTAMDARITTILLTHGHADHSKGARRLGELTGAPVRAVDPLHRCAGAGQAAGAGLAAGEVITAGALEVHVISTPGHSSDSVCFLLPSEGSLLTGDTVLGRGTSVVAWPDGRLSEYLVSLARLRDLIGRQGIERILPGHGPILGAPGDILTAYVDHRLARLDEVRAAVAAGAGSTADVVEVVYAQTPRELWAAAELSVRAQLQQLRDAGELSEDIF